MNRIVSLLPSATEIAFALGLGDNVIGVTFECDHPTEARQRRIVSTSALPEGLSPAEIDAVVKERMAAGEDLYKLDANAFGDLDPDLVLTQDLCAVCAVDVSEVDQALNYLGCTANVLTLDPQTLDQVLESIVAVGAATDTMGAAHDLLVGLEQRRAALHRAVEGVTARPTLLLEWTEPAFGPGHWVPDLVNEAGGKALLANPGANSVGLDWADVTNCGAEVVVVAPCGFRLDGAAELARTAIDAGQLPADAEVWAVDADAFFVRPGPRVIRGAEIIGSILHPDRCGPVHEAEAVRLL